MSLPEKIKLYILQDPDTREVVYVTHDAHLAVLVKEAHREGAHTVDIVTAISSRRPQAVGELENRCVGCSAPHPMSIEAVGETYKVIEGFCPRALEERRRLDPHRLMWRGGAAQN